MAKKVGEVFLICVFITFAYMLLILFQPITNSFVQSANATISASSNWSNYAGAQEVLVGWPFWLWMIPGALGVICTVLVLKGGNNK